MRFIVDQNVVTAFTQRRLAFNSVFQIQQLVRREKQRCWRLSILFFRFSFRFAGYRTEVKTFNSVFQILYRGWYRMAGLEYFFQFCFSDSSSISWSRLNGLDTFNSVFQILAMYGANYSISKLQAFNSVFQIHTELRDGWVDTEDTTFNSVFQIRQPWNGWLEVYDDSLSILFFRFISWLCQIADNAGATFNSVFQIPWVVYKVYLNLEVILDFQFCFSDS